MVHSCVQYITGLMVAFLNRSTNKLKLIQRLTTTYHNASRQHMNNPRCVWTRGKPLGACQCKLRATCSESTPPSAHNINPICSEPHYIHCLACRPCPLAGAKLPKTHDCPGSLITLSFDPSLAWLEISPTRQQSVSNTQSHAEHRSSSRLATRQCDGSPSS